MALVSGQRSTLNPNAPMYVPGIYRQVEDFSPEWWELVKSSTWFRDYWLSVSNVEEEEAEENDVAEEVEDLLPESFNLDAQFEEMVMLAEAEEKSASDQSSGSTDRVDEAKSLNDLKVDAKTLLKDIVVPRSQKERSLKSPVGPAKYHMKAAQYVSPKCALRHIHQPR